MIRFFKFSGPLQLASLFLLTFLFRVPLLFTDSPLLSEDLKHMVVGEKMADGFVLYRDILDNTPPLAALVYWVIDLVFGRSLAAYYLLSGLLVFFQAFIFKLICNANDILTEKGEIPGLMYIAASTVCFDFLSFSPCLMSLTFVLVALNNVFKHIKVTNNEGEIFTTGFFLGLAYLTYAQSVIFFLFTFLSFLLYTRTPLRHYLLFFVGFLFPVLTLLTFFYLLGGFGAFVKCYIFNFNGSIGFSSVFDSSIFLFIIIPSALISITGIIRALTYRRFINFQVICQRLMFIWLLLGLIIIVFFFAKNINVFLMLLPFIAFFLSHFFHLISRKSLGSYILIVFLLYSCRVVFSYLPVKYLQGNYIDFNGQISYECEWNKLFQNKKIAVLGEQTDIYRNNSIATPYFDWNLSKETLEGTGFYSNVILLNQNFESDMPEIIIDEKKVMPAILARIPSLQNRYRTTQMGGVYVRKDVKFSASDTKL